MYTAGNPLQITSISNKKKVTVCFVVKGQVSPFNKVRFTNRHVARGYFANPLKELFHG